MLEDRFNLFYSGLDIALLIFCGIVLGVFRKVPLFTGFTDLLGNLPALIDLEVIQLILKLF